MKLLKVLSCDKARFLDIHRQTLLAFFTVVGCSIGVSRSLSYFVFFNLLSPITQFFSFSSKFIISKHSVINSLHYGLLSSSLFSPSSCLSVLLWASSSYSCVCSLSASSGVRILSRSVILGVLMSSSVCVPFSGHSSRASRASRITFHSLLIIFPPPPTQVTIVKIYLVKQ